MQEREGTLFRFSTLDKNVYLEKRIKKTIWQSLLLLTSQLPRLRRRL
jgi:hypothetical protein